MTDRYLLLDRLAILGVGLWSVMVLVVLGLLVAAAREHITRSRYIVDRPQDPAPVTLERTDR